MTVATSTVPAALTYLVTQAKAAFPNALVCDGPMIVVDQQALPDRVTIGWDGDPDTFSPAVEGDQNFAALNRGVTRNEDYRIVCSVSHWDGGGDVIAARTAAFALLATFERLMRGYPSNGTGDVSLGGAVQWASVAGGFQVLYELGPDGAACTVIFHVTCRARLTGS
jgi:hypothetical protein